jgi:hypothetical protein
MNGAVVFDQSGSGFGFAKSAILQGKLSKCFTRGGTDDAARNRQTGQPPGVARNIRTVASAAALSPNDSPESQGIDALAADRIQSTRIPVRELPNE